MFFRPFAVTVLMLLSSCKSPSEKALSHSANSSARPLTPRIDRKVILTVTAGTNTIDNSIPDTDQLVMFNLKELMSTLPRKDRNVIFNEAGVFIKLNTLTLPDRQRLQVLGVRFPSIEKNVRAQARGLRRLNAALKSFPPNDLVVAMGDFGVSRAQDERMRFIERSLHPYWLVTHQLGCKTDFSNPCRGTTLGNDGRESFQEMILVDKSFYDGLKGWRVVRGEVVAKRPASVAVGDHWPFMVAIEPVSL